MATPERPPAIPEAARWSDELQSWELGDADGAGQRHGEYRSFRADGSLRMTCHYERGVRSGPFRIYHASGELAREGQFADGELHGRVVAHRSDAAGADPLRPCCVPDNARHLELKYERGQLLLERFLDGEGRALLSDGRLYPERPRELPEHARYDEFNDRWYTVEREGELTIQRFFELGGRLLEEHTFAAERRTHLRQFASDGSARLEEPYDESNRRHGECRVRYVDAERGPYRDSSVVEVVASFEHGEPVAAALLRRSDGTELRLERGGLLQQDEVWQQVLADEERGAEHWSDLAARLLSSKRVREALCAAARVAARAGAAQPFEGYLARSVAPLLPELAAEKAELLEHSQQPSLAAALSALLQGAEPARVLRTIAQLAMHAPLAAQDFVDAALLLSASEWRAHWTRALIRVELGAIPAALADAERVEPHSPALAAYVRGYAALVFPSWRFLPAHAEISSAFDGLPEVPAQPVEDLRRVIQVYATRLCQLRRAALQRFGAEASWLPPCLPELLPDGPLELQRFSATIVDEGDDGEQRSEVQIDERLELQGASLVQLQARARCDWAGLTWLCWCAGLDTPALPRELRPRGEFSAAASQAIARAARLADTLATGGLRARVQGAPSFQWHGFDIDELPSSFAKLAFDEYSELRALFLWLCFEQNRSPFQSDLRAL